MQLHWHTEPFLLLGLLGLGWAYAILVGPFRRYIASPVTDFPKWHATVFYLALALFYLTVGSPLDQIGEQFLFSAHMVQHMLLIYVVPILVFLGTPAWLVDAPLKNRAVRSVARFLTHPLTGGAAFTIVFTLWHVPTAYEAALQNKTIHVLEHITLFVTAMMMLWCFCSPSKVLPPPAYGIRMLTIFLLMVAQLPVFAFLSFSDSVHYPTYSWAPRIVEWLDPLGDQILGGLIMKISNMIVSLTIFGLNFYLWFREDTAGSLGSQTYSVSSTLNTPVP